MANIYVRMLILVGVVGGLIYGIVGGVWSLAIFFVMVGVYIEVVGIRDAIADRFGLPTTKDALFDLIFKDKG